MKISIESIDATDDFYRMSYFSNFSALQDSLLAVGQVQPILVDALNDGRFRVISGFRRVAAIRELGWTEVEAQTVSAETPDARFRWFRQTLFENRALRSFNWVEKAVVVWKLKNQFHLEEKEIVADWFPVLEIGQNRRWLDWLLPIPGYEPEVQRAIASDALTFDLFEFLPALDGDSRLALVSLFQFLNLGKNRQKEFFALLRDVALRKEISVAALLKREELTRILQADSLSVGQKTQRVRTLLRRWRYPHLVAVETRFQQLVREMRLPPGIQLRPPPNFEGDKFRLELTFRTPEDFSRIVDKLQTVAKSGKLDALRQLWEEA